MKPPEPTEKKEAKPRVMLQVSTLQELEIPAIVIEKSMLEVGTIPALEIPAITHEKTLFEDFSCQTDFKREVRVE